MLVKSNHARAPQGASGSRRNRRRAQRGGPAWFRPFCRASRAIDASIRLIDSTMRTVARSRRCAHRRPVRTTRQLYEVSGVLHEASTRLVIAAEQIRATTECIGREPEESAAVPDLLLRAAERWVEATAWLQEAAGDVLALQQDVLAGLESGLLVPEAPAGRPRIRLTPRPVPLRAFLLLRQVRAADRIAPLLRRRRRTPRPAAVRVPRRSVLGRAPPLFPISLV